MTSTKFGHRAPDDKVLVRCFVGGPGREEAVEKSDADIIADARAEIGQLLGVQAAPLLARVYRWPAGNAQYDVGHLDRVRHLHELCADFPGLYLTGSAYEGIGIPDCIHQGQQTAAKVLAFLEKHQPVQLSPLPIG
jgi:oxygen-dependent protoporphyrinogen oxidase